MSLGRTVNSFFLPCLISKGSSGLDRSCVTLLTWRVAVSGCPLRTIPTPPSTPQTPRKEMQVDNFSFCGGFVFNLWSLKAVSLLCSRHPFNPPELVALPAGGRSRVCILMREEENHAKNAECLFVWSTKYYLLLMFKYLPQRHSLAIPHADLYTLLYSLTLGMHQTANCFIVWTEGVVSTRWSTLNWKVFFFKFLWL